MLKVPSYDSSPDPSESDARRSWWRDHQRLLLVAFGVFVLFFIWVTWRLPLNRALEPLPDPTLVLLDRHGEPFARRGAYKEAPVDARDLPPHVTAAILAIEDRRFHDHFGVDLRGTARAALHNARAGGVEQGGSTITQQLAKTAFLEPDRTFRRKIREALIAVYLEARLSKDEILSRYLSAVYFGDGVYGLRAAAKHYFDKEPEKLDIGEAAMLAGLVKAPSRLAPTNDLEAARERTRVVLQAMVEAGAITPEQARKHRRPRVREGRATLPVGTWFADWVSPQAKEAFDADYGEIEVRTTLDSRIQRHAQRTVERWLAREGARRGASQAALVAMSPDGEVLALVGGRDYKASQYDRATQAKRQPGSAFKLFAYWAALGQGASPASPVEDTPLTLGDWSPENYDGRYAGTIPLREAFARSSNVAAVRLVDQVGPRAVIDAARELGIRSELEPDATLALGTYEVSLLELTSAYAALASGAAPVTPRGLPGLRAATPSVPLDPQRRAMMLDLLWGVVDHGTGRAAKLNVPAFGKTGTTQGYRDALFVGMAGDLVVGVWVGNDDGSPMKRVTGGGLPAQIWRDFMDDAMRMAPARANGLPAARMRVEAAPAPAPPQRFDQEDYEEISYEELPYDEEPLFVEGDEPVEIIDGEPGLSPEDVTDEVGAEAPEIVRAVPPQAPSPRRLQPPPPPRSGPPVPQLRPPQQPRPQPPAEPQLQPQPLPQPVPAEPDDESGLPEQPGGDAGEE